MAIGYGNNLMYFFVFLLVSISLVGARLTNKNVQNFIISDIYASSLYAREPNQLELKIESLDRTATLWDIEIGIDQPKRKDVIHDNIESVASGNTMHRAQLTWRPPHRGVIQAPRIHIQSRFPFGMFRAIKYYTPVKEWIIYPERKGRQDIPLYQGDDSDTEMLARLKNQGLFLDYREFQKSDSPVRIDWKRSLKHQKHLLKNFESSGEKRVLLDWKMTESLSNFEDRISQMALWIDLCQKRQDLYSVRIHGLQTDFSCHPNHYQNCMERFALLTLDEVS